MLYMVNLSASIFFTWMYTLHSAIKIRAKTKLLNVQTFVHIMRIRIHRDKTITWNWVTDHHKLYRKIEQIQVNMYISCKIHNGSNIVGRYENVYNMYIVYRYQLFKIERWTNTLYYIYKMFFFYTKHWLFYIIVIYIETTVIVLYILIYIYFLTKYKRRILQSKNGRIRSFIIYTRKVYIYTSQAKAI